MEYRADLHCHSTFSDGQLTPSELLYLAKKVGLSGISITDHDSIAAYTEELFDLSNELNIDLLTGVEISSAIKEETVHILGYGFDHKSRELKDFLARVQNKRYERNISILKKLASLNISIDETELYGDARFSHSSIGRPHIAQIMVEKGYVKDYKSAFNLYLKDGGNCYEVGEKFLPTEIIDFLHKCKAKAILAHPQQITKKKVLDALLEMNFDGLEAYYGKMMLHQEARWVRLANKKGWLITGGSDFHGETKAFVDLGSSWISKEIFDQIRSAK